MGMFDYVRVDLQGLDGDFQSKSLGCQLNNYLIDEEGIKIYKNEKYYKVPWVNERVVFYYLDSASKSLVEFYADFEEGSLTHWGNCL